LLANILSDSILLVGVGIRLLLHCTRSSISIVHFCHLISADALSH
jgi:hypothetical protein